ncbi:MAG: sodium-translocating pyrophosphatase [Dehalococcoidales bacterium]|nr:sodium-translocating pyrophosphatase [Dehalococcoidales bacterium]
MDITLFEIFRENIGSPFEKWALIAIVGIAILGLVYAAFLTRQTIKEPEGTPRMKELSRNIRLGGNVYLKRQFRTILILFFVLGVFIFFTGYFAGSTSVYGNPKWLVGLGRAGGFLIGALFSALVGYLGMNMAMLGNVRVAQAARSSFNKALKIAYRSGTVTGMLTDALGLLGGTVLFIIFFRDAPLVLAGFGFGGTLLALFMRVGGGIYTKAADVGADLVGKVVRGIPEDDPRNAAVVADQVGDNVGDCAGMAADVFESYEVTIVSALILGILLTVATGQLYWIIFPLLVRGCGVIGSVISTYQVGTLRDNQNAMKAIHRAYWIGAAITLISSFLLAYFYAKDIRFFLATAIGVVLAIATNYIADYYTSAAKRPVAEIATATKTGPATTILTGFGWGFESTVTSIIVIALAIVGSALVWHGGVPAASTSMPAELLCIFYGVSLCGIGLLTLTGNNIAMDTFGPVVDNANGIGEMAKLEPQARQILNDLDAVGNTTKAITKCIAIASAVLAAVALFAAFYADYQLTSINLIQWKVFVAFLIGGAIPFLFSSFTIRAVGRAAYAIINEVRYQFLHVKGVWEGTKDPDYGSVVAICTKAAQRELITPAILAILSPIVIGFLFGLEALAGFLSGVILVGQLLAVYMANTGNAWDNAKKRIEDGFYGGKGSDPHKASVIGDTVGDPLKDTAGPALNPLIKVINLVSVLAAPMMVVYVDGKFMSRELSPLTIGIAVAALAVISVAIWYSRRGASFGRDYEAEQAKLGDIDRIIGEGSGDIPAPRKLSDMGIGPEVDGVSVKEEVKK